MCGIVQSEEESEVSSETSAEEFDSEALSGDSDDQKRKSFVFFFFSYFLSYFCLGTSRDMLHV
jgi:hypothetical protein